MTIIVCDNIKRDQRQANSSAYDHHFSRLLLRSTFSLVSIKNQKLKKGSSFMELYDVSHWKKDEERQASGTREKFWLINPDNKRRYLFKGSSPQHVLDKQYGFLPKDVQKSLIC
ncbi:hypothetical protein QWV57_12065 [Geobacillus zalihae]|uniref:hypothetical protein n=1 Tax=Geobacillus TaxID=129337 RepID=UPI001CC1EAEB|nr:MULTISPECIES: hypothetical protein [Geobacillus]WKA46415.1 hypothetical protein QWV57_12065 [Geobacillus zalihae]